MNVNIFPSSQTNTPPTNNDGSYAPVMIYFTGQLSIPVVHNKGIRPIVSISNSIGEKIEGQIFYNNLNNFTVSFNNPQSGSITYT